MIHIAPWTATDALCRGTIRAGSGSPALFIWSLRPRGLHTAPSNAVFDASLRERNSEWGVRDLDDVARVAAEHDLRLDSVVPMPANNLSVIFR